MSNPIPFLSVQDPKRVYVQEWQFNTHCHGDLTMDFHWYEGDGGSTCRHSHNNTIIKEQWIDFLMSYCRFLCENKNASEEDIRLITRGIPRQLGRKELIAPLGVIYVAGKRRYYEKHTFSVSAADSKRHDKRWEEVQPWMDGTLKSAVNLLNLSDDTLFRRLACAWEIGQLEDKKGESYGYAYESYLEDVFWGERPQPYHSEWMDEQKRRYGRVHDLKCWLEKTLRYSWALTECACLSGCIKNNIECALAEKAKQEQPAVA